MANGNVVTTNGNKIMLNRAFKGSPDYLEPSLFKVGTDNTAPTIADTDLGSAVIITGGSTTKSFVVGYPIIDESTLQVTFRCFLASTDANGNSLTEFGIFNNDATKLMYSRAVFTSITKTSDVEVSFVQKDQMV